MIVYKGVDLTELLLIFPVECIAAILAIRWRVGKKLAARLSARLRPRRLSLFTRILSFLAGVLILLLVSRAFMYALAYLSSHGGTIWPAYVLCALFFLIPTFFAFILVYAISLFVFPED